LQKHSNIHITSLIVFLSIVSIFVQFAAYYVFISTYAIAGIACLVTIVSAHILLEKTLTYEACFIYTLLLVFLSTVITIFTYLGNEQYFMPYTDALLWIVAINWFIPTMHCLIRNMLDYGVRIENFNTFYRNNSIIFLFYYIVIVGYGLFSENAFPWAYTFAAEDANFTPFWSLATQIEDYLNHMIPISDIWIYLATRILSFGPIGYYITVLLRKKSRLLRFLSLLILPVLIEALQYFIIPERCDLDDVIYAVIGGIMGGLFFHFINLLYRLISGKSFLTKDSDYRYSHGSLHF
jgi:hypothetical protein